MSDHDGQLDPVWAALQEVRGELTHHIGQSQGPDTERLRGSVTALDHTLRALHRELAQDRAGREAVYRTFSIVLIALVITLAVSCLWMGLN